MRALEFLTGHILYNLTYTFILQTTITLVRGWVRNSKVMLTYYVDGPLRITWHAKQLKLRFSLSSKFNMIGTELPTYLLAKAFQKLINQYLSQNGDKDTYLWRFIFYHN